MSLASAFDYAVRHNGFLYRGRRGAWKTYWGARGFADSKGPGAVVVRRTCEAVHFGDWKPGDTCDRCKWILVV